jgi:hypothetical protein
MWRNCEDAVRFYAWIGFRWLSIEVSTWLLQLRNWTFRLDEMRDFLSSWATVSFSRYSMSSVVPSWPKRYFVAWQAGELHKQIFLNAERYKMSCTVFLFIRCHRIVRSVGNSYGRFQLWLFPETSEVDWRTAPFKSVLRTPAGIWQHRCATMCTATGRSSAWQTTAQGIASLL